MSRLPNNRSPDKADAVAMCFMEGDAMNGWVPEDSHAAQRRRTFMGGEDPLTADKPAIQVVDTGGWVE